MDEKATKKLFKDFPNLYRVKDKSVKDSLMRFGFECEDGWFDLIYELSKKITELDPEGKVEAVQVKEKFGGLRFYINGAPREIHDLIAKYEKKSYQTCEACGAKGKSRPDLGWVRTLCNKHYKIIRPASSKNHNSLN